MAVLIASTRVKQYSQDEMITVNRVCPSLGNHGSPSKSKSRWSLTLCSSCKAMATRVLKTLTALGYFIFGSVTGPYPIGLPFFSWPDRICIKIISMKEKQIACELNQWSIANSDSQEKRAFAKNRILKHLFLATLFKKIYQPKTLNLSGLYLTTLPECLAQFNHLKKLDLSYNQFLDFPELITDLPKLQELNLAHNRLIQLTLKSNQMQAIQKLNLSYNHLWTLPANIDFWPNLKVVDYAHNPNLVIPNDYKAKFKIINKR